jgi:CRISPR system Cascade subunit CasA
LTALERAHQLAALSGDMPTQTFALVRLLLAVLHGALGGPADVDEWEELWRAERLPAERIAGYLDHHGDRFDLFHPAIPFLQVADLHTAKGGSAELAKLVADVPNGVPFFTTRLGEELTLSYAEAARWLVHCHAFDPSGIKSGAVGDSRVKNGKGYPIGVGWSGLLGGVLLEGSTLKETLLLNLIARDFDPYGRAEGTDPPVWERPAVTAAEEQEGGRLPTGPVDLYVWQSRRIRLFPEAGRVRGVLIANGERLTPQNKHGVELHTAWRRSEAQEKKLRSPLIYMPREHNPARAIWRGLQSMLPAATALETNEASAGISPGVLEWLGHLTREEVIPADHKVRLSSYGLVYGSQSSVVQDSVHDSLGLRAILASQNAVDLASVVTSCVEAAEKAAAAVGYLAADLAAAAGGDGAGPRGQALERVYAAMDGPFRRWLPTVGQDASADRTALQEGWHRTAREVAYLAAQELLDNVSPACWAGRVIKIGNRSEVLTVAQAEAKFLRNLARVLPFALVRQPASAPAAS